MYYQITNRCNLECEHCGFACTSKGKDMPLEMFKEVISKEHPEFMVLGGGEPTMHPQFWDILLTTMRYSDNIFMATNGVNVDMTLECIDVFDKLRNASLRVSHDAYHPDVDDRIIEKIKRLGNENICIQNYSVSYQISRAGRAYTNNIYTRELCFCPEFILQPNGKVKFCACPESPIIGTYKDVIDGKLSLGTNGCIQEKEDIKEFFEYEEHKHLKLKLAVAYNLIHKNIKDGE